MVRWVNEDNKKNKKRHPISRRPTINTDSNGDRLLKSFYKGKIRCTLYATACLLFLPDFNCRWAKNSSAKETSPDPESNRDHLLTRITIQPKVKQMHTFCWMLVSLLDFESRYFSTTLNHRNELKCLQVPAVATRPESNEALLI